MVAVQGWPPSSELSPVGSPCPSQPQRPQWMSIATSRREVRSPGPLAVRAPQRQQPGARPLGGHPCALGGDGVGRSVGQIPQRLPSNRGIGIQQPVQYGHAPIVVPAAFRQWFVASRQARARSPRIQRSIGGPSFRGDLGPVPDQEARVTGEFILRLRNDLDDEFLGDDFSTGDHVPSSESVSSNSRATLRASGASQTAVPRGTCPAILTGTYFIVIGCHWRDSLFLGLPG